MTRTGKVWLHRGLAGFFAALTIPAVLWWSESVLFVILLSLATQISTEAGAAEAADDRTLADQLNRIEAHQKRGPNARPASSVLPRLASRSRTPRTPTQRVSARPPRRPR